MFAGSGAAAAGVTLSEREPAGDTGCPPSEAFILQMTAAQTATAITISVETILRCFAEMAFIRDSFEIST